MSTRTRGRLGAGRVGPNGRNAPAGSRDLGRLGAVGDEAPNPKATANVTDPDSRFLSTRKGNLQGYNAQAVTTLEQVIVAAELTDVHQLDPMLKATAATLAAAGIHERPEAALADSSSRMCSVRTTSPTVSRSPVPMAGCDIGTSPFRNGLLTL